jgi:hypothetical protein
MSTDEENKFYNMLARKIEDFAQSAGIDCTKFEASVLAIGHTLWLQEERIRKLESKMRVGEVRG